MQNSHAYSRMLPFAVSCQDYFMRRANKGLQPSTHLIANTPEGSKYAAAKKWNLPAITKQ